MDVRCPIDDSIVQTERWISVDGEIFCGFECWEKGSKPCLISGGAASMILKRRRAQAEIVNKLQKELIGKTFIFDNKGTIIREAHDELK